MTGDELHKGRNYNTHFHWLLNNLLRHELELSEVHLIV